MPLLEIRNLTVEFPTDDGVFRAVDGLDLDLDRGEVLGIVGESGSGKSVTMLALMGLLPWPARVRADRMSLDGIDLRNLRASRRQKIMGKDIAMVFQEPMTSLNPCFSVGFQLVEALKTHEGGPRAALPGRAVELLEKVGVPDPERRIKAFPHQLSGGMCQRVMIAMAIACRPRLLIADEPTTALDVTIQAEILGLLAELQREQGMAMVLITHDMGVVAEAVDRVMVMYASQQLELQRTRALFANPRHPYTAALLEALPERNRRKRRLSVIPGTVPGLADRPSGCIFSPRCQSVDARCREVPPSLVGLNTGQIRCHRPLSEQPR